MKWMWILFLLLGTSVLGTSVFWIRYGRPFFDAADITPQTFVAQVRQGLNTSPSQSNGRKNFLILGTDEVEGRNSPGVLTDTIMLLSLDLSSAKGTLIPIPRDLWLAEYKTKINAMYYYGKEKYPDAPENLTKEVVERVTGLPIHHVVLLKLSFVAQVIDALGGVDINVEKGFTDPQFPRDGVDVTKERDLAKLYETVTFVQGEQHMDGATALKYMRSRHSSDLAAGTDDARALRQQQVIWAVIAAVKKEVVEKNTAALGRVFAVYSTSTLSREIPFPELVATANVMRGSLMRFTLDQYSMLPLLIHPPTAKYKQWVYEPIDPTWAALQSAVKTQLSL